MSLYCDMGPDVFVEDIKKAAKQHNCCECGHPIKKGMLYWYCKGLWEGDWSQYRQHIECRDACYTISQTHECIPFGALDEWIFEYDGSTWVEKWVWAKPGEPRDSTIELRQRDELAKQVRSLFSRGHNASRLKTKEQILKYNEQHKGRTT